MRFFDLVSLCMDRRFWMVYLVVACSQRLLFVCGVENDAGSGVTAINGDLYHSR